MTNKTQQQSTPKSKDPDAKREARNITVSDTAHLHRRGDKTENLSSKTAHLHRMVSKTAHLHSTFTG